MDSEGAVGLGMKVSGGTRPSHDMPPVFQAYNCTHGVYLAATMGSEATAAAVGQAAMRRDPMAMLPFCATGAAPGSAAPSVGC